MTKVAFELKPKLLKRPFIHPDHSDLFYCTKCKEYSNNFTPYAIRTKYKQCRNCQHEKQRKFRQNMTDLTKLKRKLYHNLLYQGFTEFAKALCDENVEQILKHNQVDKVSTVKTIMPNFDPRNDTLNFQVIFSKDI